MMCTLYFTGLILTVENLHRMPIDSFNHDSICKFLFNLKVFGLGPIWCDCVKGSVESVPGDTSETGLGHRSPSYVPAI